MAFSYTLDDEKHEYLLDGVPLPSVTGILGDIVSKAYYPAGPYKLRGSRVHEATVLYDQGKLDQYEVGDTIKGYVESWSKLYLTHPFMWTDFEKSGYDKKLLVAGTTDRIGKYDIDYNAIADIKTGDPEPEAELQTAAYALLNFPDSAAKVRRFIVRLYKDGAEPKVIEHKDPYDLQAWPGVVQLYKWRKRRSARKVA